MGTNVEIATDFEVFVMIDVIKRLVLPVFNQIDALSFIIVKFTSNTQLRHSVAFMIISLVIYEST